MLAQPVNATVEGDYQRFIWSNAILELYDDPSSECYDKPITFPISTSPSIEIPLLYSCQEGSRPDTLRVTLDIEGPVTAKGFSYPPEVMLLVVELVDPINGITRRTPFYFSTHSE